jgi:hypothetical protein
MTDRGALAVTCCLLIVGPEARRRGWSPVRNLAAGLVPDPAWECLDARHGEALRRFEPIDTEEGG